MGGERSEKTAKEIAVDVSKYLKYACGRRCPVADWGRLTDHDMLIGYFEKLKRVKVGQAFQDGCPVCCHALYESARCGTRKQPPLF